jgi:hypothetical protein
VLHKLINAEFNAVTRRLASAMVVRKQPLVPRDEVKLFLAAYGVENSANIAAQFRSESEQIYFNYSAIYDWLVERPDGLKIESEVSEIVSQGIDVLKLNFVKVHVKLESLLKEDPIESFREQKQRIIVWQVKGVTAMYSAIFKQAKERTKLLLKPNVKYVDGVTPEALGEWLSTIGVVDDGEFLMDDLTQQDKQTDKDDINLEMAWYGYVGVHHAVLESWLRVHKLWRARGKYLSFMGDYMRLTGQATTSLGNFVINAFCHAEHVIELGSRLQAVMFLGDDNLMYYQHHKDPKPLNRRTADKYNMYSTATVHSQVGQFCSLLVVAGDNGHLHLCPDLVRLSRRYEVTSGVSKADDQNTKMRAMSYALMLGPSPALETHATNEGWPINLAQWYDPALAVSAAANFHGVSREFVLSKRMHLEAMLLNPQLHDTTLTLNASSRK